jgi:SAM-dependent methyltransferase
MTSDDAFSRWLAALEARHRADLTFAEIRRGLQALSSLYVERRGRIASGAALDGAGKRAAFALYLAPLHFLIVREVVRALNAAEPAPSRIVDLGCGTGAAGAAWALEASPRVSYEGVDRSAWAAGEARWTLKVLGLRGRAQAGDLDRVSLPGRGGAVVAAFTVNELDAPARGRLLHRLLEAARAGARVLVVEPIAKRAAPWWSEWAAAVVSAGGRADEWRFPAALPETLAALDRAAGLDHRELLARSLWIGPRSTEVSSSR